MHPFVFLGVAVTALIGGLLYAKKGVAATMETEMNFRALYEKYGARYGVDPDLIEAIAMVESSQRSDAVRWNPPHDVSVGLMQVLCTPPEGTPEGADYYCANKFNIGPWPVLFSDLKNPDLNVCLGTQILAWNLRAFGYPRGVAVYNAWEARHASLNGPFPNQSYVDKVLSNLGRIKA